MTKEEYLYPINTAINHIDLLFQKLGDKYKYYLVEKAFELRFNNESRKAFNDRTSMSATTPISGIELVKLSVKARQDSEKFGIEKLLKTLRDCNRLEDYASSIYPYLHNNTTQEHRAAVVLREGAKIIVDVMLKKERLEASSTYEADAAIQDMRNSLEVIRLAVVQERKAEAAKEALAQQQQEQLKQQSTQQTTAVQQQAQHAAIEIAKEETKGNSIITIAIASVLAMLAIAVAIKKKRK